MTDRVNLMITALLGASLGWLFWHSLERDAFAALSTVGFVIVAIDNACLRRKLRATKG